jgi:hypothetical protein
VSLLQTQHQYCAPTVTDLMAALGGLEPRERNDKVIFNCPDCGGRRKAFVKLEKTGKGGNLRPNYWGDWKCNRGSCGASGSLLDPSSQSTQRTTSRRQPTLKTRPRVDNTKSISKGLGSLSPAAHRYLSGRLRGLSVSLLEDSKLVGDPSRIGHDSAKDYQEWGYELLVPLHGIREPSKIASAQCRFTGTKNPENKILSLKGNYPTGGVTFGRLDHALEAANNAGRLIIAEGLIDFLTLRALGLKNVVGVPGCAQADKVIKHLGSQGWAGDVVLSLDGDEAGAIAVAGAVKAASPFAAIKLFNGRPSAGDINDVMLAAGKEAVLALLASAQPITAKTPTLDLQSYKPERLSFEARARARELRIRHDKGTALRGVGRVGVCGLYLYIVDKDKVKAGVFSRKAGQTIAALCDSRACVICRFSRWETLRLEAEEKWPAQLLKISIPLTENTPEAATKERGRLSRRTAVARTEEKSGYMSLVDPLTGMLSVLVDPADSKLVDRLKYFYEDEVTTIKRDEALDTVLFPAFLGFPLRIAEMLKQENGVEAIEEDAWCKTRARSWSFTKDAMSLKLSANSKLEEEDNKKRQAKAEENREPLDKDEFEIFSYVRADSSELSAVTLEPLSPANRMALAVGEPMTLLPGQRGNLLDAWHCLRPEIAAYLAWHYRDKTGLEISERSPGPRPVFKKDGGMGATLRQGQREDAFRQMKKVILKIKEAPWLQRKEQ